MTTEQIPKAIKEGNIKIGGMTLQMLVLEDGQRVIEEQSFLNFMNAMVDGTLKLSDNDAVTLAKAIQLGEFDD